MFTSMPTIWTSQAWRDEAHAWIRDSVRQAGLEVVGPIEQFRVRLWSIQLTVETTAGTMWFKENHPGQAAEAAVIDVLGRIVPDHVAVPVAVERSRGWLLTPDHGQTLYNPGTTDEGLWCRTVSQFADLQRRVAGRHDDLVAAGLVPLLPANAADRIEQQVQRLRLLPPSDVAFIGSELADRLLGALPAIRAVADRLAAISPPLESLEHNDLHQNNVFMPRGNETTLRFFDFGDAVWAHPFTTLAVPVEALCHEWGVTADDARVERVVDSYLDAWDDLGSRIQLRESARLAQKLHPLHRYESWRRMLEGGPRAELPEVAGTLEHWLGRVADIHPD